MILGTGGVLGAPNLFPSSWLEALESANDKESLAATYIAEARNAMMANNPNASPPPPLNVPVPSSV
jgi:hypothetical protein